MSILDPGPRPGRAGHDAAKPGPSPDRLSPLSLPGTLTAARLKVALTLNAAELNAIKAPKDKPRLTLRVRLPDRTLAAEIATKSLRKVAGGVPRSRCRQYRARAAGPGHRRRCAHAVQAKTTKTSPP